VSAVRPLAAVAILVVLLLSACGTARDTGSPGPAASAAVSPEFNEADVAFTRALIPHLQQGVQIAELGAQRATRPEAKMLAGAIVATQKDEIGRLRGWLTTWKQPPPSAGPPIRQLAALRTSPPSAFDRQFLDLLIAHQGAAVRLARIEIGAGRNRNALAYARQVDKSRTAQIAQLTGYRNAGAAVG
jgi:uncharacterized protein (DUF305 family)